MSVWYEIDGPDDIDFSKDGEEVHILYDSDETGNYYVSVDLGILNKVFKKVGLQIIRTP